MTVSKSMSENERMLFTINFFSRIGQKRECTVEKARRALNVRKKVDRDFPRKKAQVTVQSKSHCRFVHAKGLLEEWNGDQQTHQRAECDLDDLHNFKPNRRTGLHDAKQNVKYLVDKRSESEQYASCYVACTIGSHSLHTCGPILHADLHTIN